MPRPPTPQAFGGLMYSAGGRTSLSNGSILRNGTAPAGRTVFLAAGEVVYMLPAPAGRWLPNAVCQVYRAGCSYPTSSQQAEQDACAAIVV